MPITSDFSIFSSRYKKSKIKKFCISPTSPSAAPQQKQPEQIFNSLCYFSRVSIEQLQVGDIIKYNQKGKENICKVIKITPSKKSFKKIDGHLSHSGIFTESGISNIIDKDIIVNSRKIFKMHNFNKNIWRKNLLYLINCNFKKGQVFTTPEVYEKCEGILQKVYPKSRTIRASILANLQFLRDEKYIKFISLGKYILL
jgi:hypothetical protein